MSNTHSTENFEWFRGKLHTNIKFWNREVSSFMYILFFGVHIAHMTQIKISTFSTYLTCPIFPFFATLWHMYLMQRGRRKRSDKTGMAGRMLTTTLPPTPWWPRNIYSVGSRAEYGKSSKWDYKSLICIICQSTSIKMITPTSYHGSYMYYPWSCIPGSTQLTHILKTQKEDTDYIKGK